MLLVSIIQNISPIHDNN